MDYITRIKRALDFIEENLKNKTTLKQIAASAYFSEYHFHRIFHGITGENVMCYLRKRRLTEAAKETLLSDRNLLEIAIFYQFDSQESFTRAFKKIFGTTPGKYRQNNKRYLVLYKNPITIEKLNHYKENLTMEPKIVEMDEIKLIGMSCKTSLANNKVPELWQSFIPRMAEVPNRTNQSIALGVCQIESNFDFRDFGEDSVFTEISGVEVSNFNNVPEGMVTHTIPASKYTVFTHKGNVEGLKKTYDYIYGVWFPKQKYEIAQMDTFEYYDERFISPEDPNSEMDIFIPIK